ncbi:MAG: hypothetical protein AAFZ52_20055, partial [Bacteroidota bacterium]
YDLLATLAGISPARPGFNTVSVRPANVDFGYSATVAHPEGTVQLTCTPRLPKATDYRIVLPPGVTGIFDQDGQRFTLRSGENQVTVGRE